MNIDFNNFVPKGKFEIKQHEELELEFEPEIYGDKEGIAPLLPENQDNL